MKVLEKGTGKSDWSFETKCTGFGWEQDNKPCHSNLELDDADIQYRDYTDMGGDSERFYGFTCPICKCFTQLYEKDIPRNVKSYASKYVSKRDRGDK
jgi:hypothetical protein